MVIKVFVSGISASKEIKKRQQRALIILDSCKVDYESIDITEPGMEEVREFMQQNSKVRSPNKTPVAPQFFNDEEYCGDYEDFDSAVEVNQVLQFLKLEAPTEEAEEIKNTTNGVLEENNRKEEASPSEKEEVENEGEDLTNKVEHEELDEDIWGDQSQDDKAKKRKKEQEGDSELAEESPAAEIEEESWGGQSEGHKRLKVQDEERVEAEDEPEEERDFWGDDASEDKKISPSSENEDEEEESD